MKNKVSNKIEKDKYYTNTEVANYCWEMVDKVIGLDNITEIIEPSVGNGAFCQYKRKPDICIDIEPEYEGALKQDYLTYEAIYKEGRLVIGNPPYGNRNYLVQEFFKKSIEIADYVAFILPINQLNNSFSLRDGKLLYSEDLGEQEYSGRKLHCCFNIYKRLGKYEERDIKEIISSDIKIYRHDQDIQIVNSVAGGKKNIKYDELKEYDVRMVYWGNSCTGKILSPNDKRYAGEYKIVVDKRNKDRDKIIEFIKTHDWKSECKSISMKRLSKQDILNVLAKKFNINQTKEKTILDFLNEANNG